MEKSESLSASNACLYKRTGVYYSFQVRELPVSQEIKDYVLLSVKVLCSIFVMFA